MNKEQKAKIGVFFASIVGTIILLWLSVFFALPFIYLFLFFSVFVCLMIGSELYLRIQHNIDRVQSEIDQKTQIIKNNLNSEIKVLDTSLVYIKKIEELAEKQKKFNEGTVEFFSSLLKKLSENNIENTRRTSELFDAIANATKNMDQKKDLSEFLINVNKMDENINKMDENINKSVVGLDNNFGQLVGKLDDLKFHIDTKFSNYNAAQKKINGAIEELLGK